MIFLACLLLGLASCATVLPTTNSDHKAISELIQQQVGKTKQLSPIRIEANSDTATAYYTIDHGSDQQQPHDPRKDKFIKNDGQWILKSTESNRPWHWRFK